MAFNAEPLDTEDLKVMFQAATLAPSAYNDQPWMFFVANRNSTGFADVFQTLAPANREWAKNAGALVVTAARINLSLNGEPNYHALHDLGASTANLLLQAQAMGYVTHVMGGFDHIAIRETLYIDEAFALGSIIAIGKSGDIEQLTPQQKHRQLSPRVRKSLSDVVKML